jgi:hypothetical protein
VVVLVTMHIQYLDSDSVGGYKMQAIRTNDVAQIFQPKFFNQVWPGSREILMQGINKSFIGPMSAFHVRNLTAPGTKRLFYLEDVWMPWKIQRHMNILFGYQLEATGSIYFLIESSDNVTDVIVNSVNSSWQKNIISFLLFFPISLIFLRKLFKNKESNIKAVPDFESFQTFVAKNYMKVD